MDIPCLDLTRIRSAVETFVSRAGADWSAIKRAGKAVPVQVSWEAPTDRHRRALDAFHRAHPHAAEAVFITRESFEHGVPELAP